MQHDRANEQHSLAYADTSAFLKSSQWHDLICSHRWKMKCIVRGKQLWR